MSSERAAPTNKTVIRVLAIDSSVSHAEGAEEGEEDD